jgi:hypothetical protein
MKSGKIIISAMVAALLVALLSCSGKPQQAFVSFCTGDVRINKAGESPRSLRAGDPVADGDVIETAGRSYVIIQAGDALIRFESDSRVVLTSIMDITKRQMELQKGKILSRVSRLKKGNEYIVKTPTAVASVRGTEFLTQYSEGKTSVAVGKGKVSVTSVATGEEKPVETGNAAVVSEAMELRTVNRVEELELQKLAGTPLVEGADRLENDTVRETLRSAERKDAEINLEIERSLESGSWTFEKIKAKYGRIDEVTLYNGRMIRGAILSRDSVVRILTPGGIVTVNAKDIRTTRAI